MYLLVIDSELISDGSTIEEYLPINDRSQAIEHWYRSWMLIDSGREIRTGQGKQLKRFLRARLVSAQSDDRTTILKEFRARTATPVRDTDNITVGLSDDELGFLKELAPD